MQSKLNKYYYVNGSSAYKYDNYEIESYYNKKALNDERIKKERLKLKMKARVRAVGIILLIFALACTILYRNVVIIESATEAQNLENKLTSLQATNTKLDYELKKEVDLKKIEELATTKLGMKRPDKNQTVYVDVTQKNYAELSTKPVKDEFSGTYSVIKQNIINVLEYLQ